MVLPVIKSAVDCADLQNTVLPYTQELYRLPQLIFENISSPTALRQIYLDTNPLVSAFALSLFLAPIFLITSEINKNYSQVDRCWSLLPTVYNAHFAIYAHMQGLEPTRLDVVAAISAIWSTRLTFNYTRKGGYSIGSEDYRWEILREHMSPPLFFVFNVTFISLIQSVLLFSVTTPTYIMALASRIAYTNPTVAGFTSSSAVSSFDSTDFIFASIMCTCVTVSAIGDQQQWNYQNAKKDYQAKAKVPAGYDRADLDRGFVTTGLWAYSRHPNFAAEQSFWVTLYFWGCYISQTTYNWTAIGAVSYLMLFQGSTWFTELLSAKKYPEYKQYQKSVAMFLPGINTGTPNWDTVEETKKTIQGTAQKGKKQVDAATKRLSAETDKARERYNLRQPSPAK